MDYSFLQPILIGICVFSSVLCIFWPFLMKSVLNVRARKIKADRKSNLYQVVDLTKEANSDNLRSNDNGSPRILAYIGKITKVKNPDIVAKQLRLAGFRGQSALTNFLAIRLISPFALFFILLVYVPVVIRPDIPFGLLVLIVAFLSCLGFYAPSIYIKNRVLKRKRAIIRSWPDTLDLLLISVESGMSLEAAFRKTSNDMIRYNREIAEELSITTAELSYLHDRKQAFMNLADRTDASEIRSVTTALIQAEKYGTALGDTLRILSQESRMLRMRAAEKKASGLSPKLTVPMILFFMPVLMVVLVMPALIKAMGLR